MSLYGAMIRLIGIGLLTALLAACVANSSSTGGNDNGSSSAVRPAEPTVAAGATQQFSVDADNNGDVSWRVNGIAGGNDTLGAISDGLYTAPNLPPAGGSVTITAVSEDDSAIGTARARIAFSNASLQGPYVFSWRGQSNNGPFAVIGRFKADGNGAINSGREDINLPNGVALNRTFDGSYEVDNNGTGHAVFVSSRGSAELHFVIGIGGRASVIRVDAGAVATGELIPQDENAAHFAGDHVFQLDGTDATGRHVAAIGRFSADGDGDITSGLADRGRGGAVTRAAGFNGAYELDDNGHGRLALTGASGTRHYTFYAASTDETRLLRIDQGQPFTGRILPQADSDFSAADLADNYVFYLFGDGGANGRATIGILEADGNGRIRDGIFDRIGNQGGAIHLAGVYTIGSSGRGTATLSSSSGRTQLAFYLQSPHHAVALDIGANAVRGGQFIAQSDADFSDATLNGPYTLMNKRADNPVAGRIVLNGDGDVGNGVEITGNARQAINLGGNYTLKDTGRGELVLATSGGGRQNYILYAISPARLLLLGSGTNAMSLGQLRRQWPPAK